jgi:hypothetical protein
LVREADGDGEDDVEYHCRLAVPVVLVMRDGTRVKVSVLVDTGSEVNLVRPGLLDDWHSRPCGPGVSFYAVNQQSLGGNHNQVSCDLIMQGVEQDTEERHELVFPLKAYDALVDVDVLLSYEWLARQDVHIHVRQHGLTIARAGLSFWVAGICAGAKVRGDASGVCVVRKIPIQQPD